MGQGSQDSDNKGPTLVVGGWVSISLWRVTRVLHRTPTTGYSEPPAGGCPVATSRKAGDGPAAPLKHSPSSNTTSAPMLRPQKKGVPGVGDVGGFCHQRASAPPHTLLAPPPTHLPPKTNPKNDKKNPEIISDSLRTKITVRILRVVAIHLKTSKRKYFRRPFFSPVCALDWSGNGSRSEIQNGFQSFKGTKKFFWPAHRPGQTDV